MRVSIVNVEIEVKKPGPRGWSLATVTYLHGGETKRQNVASFTNPQVFKDVQKYIGTDVEVEIGKNEKNYDEWKQIKPADASSPSTASTSGNTGSSTPSTRVSGSNYETPAERARRQVLIVRQSSLSNALDYLKSTDKEGHFGVSNVLEVAEQFAEWVFEQEELNDEEERASA